MNHPWTKIDVADVVFLSTCFVVTVAVPLIYSVRANLRDPLARAILLATGMPALVLAIRLVVVVCSHYGFPLSTTVWLWMGRTTTAALAIGEMTMLVALLRAYRDRR